MGAMNEIQVGSRLDYLLAAEQKVERTPFTIRAVQDEKDLRAAVSIRHSAYARHIPAVAEQLREPEACDREDGVVVLLATSKMDGRPIGTMRIQTNFRKSLALEESVTLPDWLQGRTLAEATRLGVGEGRVGRLVKTMLFKAYYEYCAGAGIEWMVITARAPLDRQYDALLFQDIAPGLGFVPMRHVGNIPHRVLAFEVGTAQERWAAARHPLYDFVFDTHHPDIEIESGPVRRIALAARREIPNRYAM